MKTHSISSPRLLLEERSGVVGGGRWQSRFSRPSSAEFAEKTRELKPWQEKWGVRFANEPKKRNRRGTPPGCGCSGGNEGKKGPKVFTDEAVAHPRKSPELYAYGKPGGGG